jgi:hypothetical protein
MVLRLRCLYYLQLLQLMQPLQALGKTFAATSTACTHTYEALYGWTPACITVASHDHPLHLPAPAVVCMCLHTCSCSLCYMFVLSSTTDTCLNTLASWIPASLSGSKGVWLPLQPYMPSLR